MADSGAVRGFRFQPDPIISHPKDDEPTKSFKLHVNRNVQRMATAHQTLDQTAIKAPTLGAGFAVMSGSETVTGSKLAIPTGLTVVSHVIASIDNADVPTNFWVTARVTPTDQTSVDIFVWQPTSNADNTPIASTTAVTVRWWATGTSEAS